MLPHHTDGQKRDVEKNRQNSSEQRPAEDRTVKQEDIDGKYASHQRKEQPCRENQQRQREERALRGRVPEEDFAEEGFHISFFQSFWAALRCYQISHLHIILPGSASRHGKSCDLRWGGLAHGRIFEPEGALGDIELVREEFYTQGTPVSIRVFIPSHCPVNPPWVRVGSQLVNVDGIIFCHIFIIDIAVLSLIDFFREQADLSGAVDFGPSFAHLKFCLVIHRIIIGDSSPFSSVVEVLRE